MIQLQSIYILPFFNHQSTVPEEKLPDRMNESPGVFPTVGFIGPSAMTGSMDDST
jgi:hypothetical protein